MARLSIRTRIWPTALGAVAALLLSAPAGAEPTAPGPPPGPVEAPVQPAAAAAPAEAPVAAPEPVPHLSSPENLPPGTTELAAQPEGPRMGYLRELWHAYQTQEVSGSDALLLLTQRPMIAAPAPAPLPGAAPAPADEPVPQPAPAPAAAPDSVAPPVAAPSGTS